MVWIRQLMPNRVLKEMNKLDFITDLCIIWNTVKIVSLSKFQITKTNFKALWDADRYELYKGSL